MARSIIVQGTLCLDPDCRRPMVPERRIEDVPAGFVRHQGRGLCHLCYFRHERADTLLDFPRFTRSYDDTLEDWDVLRRQEKRTREEAAARLGMTVAALDSVITRGVAAGDPRAVWAPKSRHPLSVEAARRAVAEGRKGWPRALAVA